MLQTIHATSLCGIENICVHGNTWHIHMRISDALTWEVASQTLIVFFFSLAMWRWDDCRNMLDTIRTLNGVLGSHIDWDMQYFALIPTRDVLWKSSGPWCRNLRILSDFRVRENRAFSTLPCLILRNINVQCCAARCF